MKKIILLTFALLVSTASNANDWVEYEIRIDGITCPFCVVSSENALKKIEGIQAISTNIETGTMTVCAESSLVLEDSQLRKLFLKKGFTYRSFTKSDVCTIDADSTNTTSLDEHHTDTDNKPTLPENSVTLGN